MVFPTARQPWREPLSRDQYRGQALGRNVLRRYPADQPSDGDGEHGGKDDGAVSVCALGCPGGARLLLAHELRGRDGAWGEEVEDGPAGVEGRGWRAVWEGGGDLGLGGVPEPARGAVGG